MIFKLKQGLSGLCLPLILSACISETAVENQERIVTDALGVAGASPPLGGQTRSRIDPSRIDMQTQAAIAREFSLAYLDIARGSAQSRDALTAVVIGAAAFTGYGLVEGVSDATIAKRAVAGLAINEGADYASPPKATDALYLSARRMNCLGTQVLMFSDLERSDAIAGRAVAWGAISEVRIQLREGLRREVPSYEDVFSRFKAVVASNTGIETTSLRSGPSRLPDFVKAVETCLVAERPEAQ